MNIIYIWMEEEYFENEEKEGNISEWNDSSNEEKAENKYIVNLD